MTKRIPFDAIVLDQSNMSLRHLAEAVTSICGHLYDATYQNEEAQHLFGPQAGHGQHFENAGFLSKRTSPWMAEGAAARLARE